ncbi:MAG: WbqC family protein [Crocinitomicaceae bacterium]|nr:WbqC family protein [Crocinitomicaceae bacterium]
MALAVFPTAYFGNIAYFAELAKSTSPIIEGKEHFVKQTIRTRCSILGANGIQQLSIPVIRPNGSKTLMEDVLVSETDPWKKIHWRSIESAYASAPFFEEYDQEIKQLIFQDETNLLRYNQRITEEILKLIDINLELGRTESYETYDKLVDFRMVDFESPIEIKKYIQVFVDSNQFSANLSILDLLFCEGPMARKWLINS